MAALIDSDQPRPHRALTTMIKNIQDFCVFLKTFNTFQFFVCHTTRFSFE